MFKFFFPVYSLSIWKTFIWDVEVDVDDTTTTETWPEMKDAAAAKVVQLLPNVEIQ